MFKYQTDAMKVPAYIWMSEEEYRSDPGMVQQVENIASLPFAFHHVVLAPDGHQGFGMPIGGVLAAKDAVVPNAVGVDIGCGVCFSRANVPAALLRQKTGGKALLEKLVNAVLKAIPTGFDHHKKPQPCAALDHADVPSVKKLNKELERGYYQIGTLGGGNHFIEWQEDDEGQLAIMIHSGSRNFGYQICSHFNKLAKTNASRWKGEEAAKRGLAFLPTNTSEGQTYLSWMDLAQRFARENRAAIMKRVQQITLEVLAEAGTLEVSFTEPLDVHHNYAAFETHFEESVIVHRKGAIRVGEGELGVVPGAMGSYSYIVQGLGNPDSFYSCSHGAGRKMGRREALRTFSADEVVRDLEEVGVILGKVKRKDVAEEARFAYKDINSVIGQELDLIRPIERLHTIAVVKG